MILRNAIETILNAIYPPRCPVCQEILEDPGGLVCPSCAAGLKPLTGPRCFSCSRPVGENEEYCDECRRTHHFYDQGLSVFPYDERMRKSILSFKEGGQRQYAAFYARCMAAMGADFLNLWRPDVLIPVPMHYVKRRDRGFNQAELIATELSLLTGIPCRTDLVIKTRATAVQKSLDASGRRRNLEGAFTVCVPVPGLRAVIVDDVYTTGSTIDTVSRALKQAGAEQVFFMTLCIVI